VVICRHRGQSFLFTDPGGLFGVFHTIKPGAVVQVSCNAELIAESEGYGASEKAMEFFARPAYRSSLPMEVPTAPSLQGDNWWPGTMTPYTGVVRLLPNHFLALEHLKSVRYWPRSRIAPQTIEEGARQGAHFMRQVVCGLARKRPIAVPVTAGFDTCLLLAASREVKDRVEYFCYSPNPEQFSTKDDEDAATAATLAYSLGFDIHIFHFDRGADEDAADRFSRNTSFHTAAKAVLQICSAFVDRGPQDRLVLNGNVSEVCRNFYGVLPSCTPAKIWTHLIRMADSPLAKEEVASWLRGLRSAKELAGVELSDLFYWEFRIGGWQSLLQLQMSQFVEMFTPYNCRSLMETMLGVDLKYRSGPDYVLYKKMIEYLWPECLSVPINPVDGRCWKRKVRLGVARHRYLNLVARGLDAATYGITQATENPTLGRIRTAPTGSPGSGRDCPSSRLPGRDEERRL
jgi:hypothetical protein